MNEEALKYAYDLFKKDGYAGSVDDYKNLIQTDKEAFDYSYQLFSNDGYEGKVEDFSTLLGMQPSTEQQPTQQPKQVQQPTQEQSEMFQNIPTQETDTYMGMSGTDPMQNIKMGEPTEDSNEFEEPSKWQQSKNVVYNTWQGIKKSFLDTGVGIQLPQYKLEKLIESGVEKLQDRFDIADETAELINDLLSPSRSSVKIDGQRETVSETLAGVSEKSAEIGGRMQYVKPALQSIREGDIAGVAMGAVNGAMGYVPSILVGASTGGLGFVPMFAGSGFVDGANLKAEMSDTDIKEIINSNEADVFVPALMGGLAGWLEKRGLKGMKDLVTKKVLSSKGLDVAKNILSESGRQGFINWLEGGLMHYNLKYAETGDYLKSAEGMAEWLISEEGANAAIEAGLGTLVTGGAGAGIQRMRTPNKSATDSQTEELVSEEKPPVTNIERRDFSGNNFVGENNNFVYENGELSQSKAEKMANDLADEYPNMSFTIKDNTDKSDPTAKANFTVVASPKQTQSYTLNGETATREQVQEAVENAQSKEDLANLSIENDQELNDSVELKMAELDVLQATPTTEESTETQVEEAPKLSEQTGNEVTVRIADQNVSGIVNTDEGGKVTLETPQGRIYELEDSTPFTEYTRPVSVTQEGDIEVNGEAFQEARVVMEDGKPKALLIREDGTTKAVTSPAVVEEIRYQIALSNMESLSDQEADTLIQEYEQQRETETASEEGTTQDDGQTAEDARIQEALEEIDLIEQMALEELEQAESSAKLVEVKPKGARQAKVYLVNKNEDGTYSATLNGRKVKRQEVLTELGQAYETETGNLVGKLQEQVNALKADVEQNLFGKNEKQEKSDSKELLEGVRETGNEGQVRESSEQLRSEEKEISNEKDSPTNQAREKGQGVVENDTRRSKETAEALESINQSTPYESVRNANTADDVAVAYDAETSNLESISAEDQAISNVIGKVKRKSYIDNADANSIGQNIGKSWFNNKSGENIDVIAQEASDNSGLDIQPSDVVAFIEKYTDADSIRRPAGNPILAQLNEKYAALTGKKLNIRTAKQKAAKARPRSENVIEPVTDLEKRRQNTWEQAIAENYTQEGWNKLSYQDKAEYLDNYFQFPNPYTAEDIRLFEQYDVKERPTPEKMEEYNSKLDILEEQGKLDEYIEGRKAIDEIIVEENAQPSEIQQAKNELKDALNEVRTNFTKGGFDKLGAQFDFKAAMEASMKAEGDFYNSIVRAVKAYVRLKGLQASEIYSRIEGLLKTKLNSEDRKLIKSIIDEARKEIPKVNVMSENKDLTKDQQVKQGVEELIEAKRREAEEKIKKEREKANKRVQNAKDKGKEKLDQFKNIKKTMIEFLKMDLQDIQVSSFTRGEFQKLLTQIDKAKTDHTLNQAISQAYDIFADSAKRQRVARAKGKVKVAKTNIKSGKIGVLEPNSLIDQMLRLDPKIIPNNIFPLYEAVLDQIGARKTVLSLSEKGAINNTVSEVLKAVDIQNSRVIELKDMYDSFENKGKNFSETIDRMLKEDEITSEEAELMRLYKKEITEEVISEPTEKDTEQAISDSMQAVESISMPVAEYSESEKSIIRTIKSITKEDLADLSYAEILRVAKVVDNMNSGFIPHLAEKIRQRVEGNRSAKKIMPVLSSYKGSWTNFISAFKASIKNIKNPKATTTLREKIRRNPNPYIDQILGNFKNTSVYDNVFRKIARGQANYENDVNTYIETVRKAINKLPKNHKKQFDSRVKLMMLAIQREFESNPNQKGTNTAKAFVDATISDNASVYTTQSKDQIKSIFDQYTKKDGELDSDKLYKSLTQAEKDAFNAVNELNRTMLRPKAMDTSTLLRGNRVPIYDNYIHLPMAVIGDSQAETDVKNLQYGFTKVSSRAGTLVERTGKAHAILFDFFANSTEGAKMTLLDYNMTPSIKEVNQTFSHLYKLSENQKDRDTISSLEGVYKELMTNVFGIQLSSTSLGESVVQEIMRKGYQATLSGVGRSSSEFLSNATFAGIYKPTETLEGINIINKNNEVTLSRVVRNLQSAQSNRLYAAAGMESKHIDFSKMNVKEVSKMSGYEENVLRRMFEAIKQNPAYEMVDQIQSFMVSKPDQLVGRPMFFGSFQQQFESITGKKPDFKKIAENDSKYMEENFDALQSATNFADDVMVEAVASSNPIDGIVRNQVPPSKEAIYTWFKIFNGYMTRFPTYEYNSAVRAVHSLRNNGMMSSQDAVRLLVALNVRLFSYSLLTGTLVKMAYSFILSTLFDYEEPEEEKTEEIQNVLAQQSLSALAMLAVNRNIGNVGKIPINIALELANKEYGEGVTYKGKYDSFDNSIVYPIVPLDVERGQKSLAQSVIENTAGPLSPQVKTVFRSAKALEMTFKGVKDETKDKYRNELLTRTPFEVLGNLGYIPAYKDLRTMMLNMMYNNQKEVEKVKKNNRGAKRVEWNK